MVIGFLSFMSLYSVYRLFVSLEHSKTVILKGWGNDFFNTLGNEKYEKIQSNILQENDAWEEVDTLSPKNIYPSPKPS